jgi:hypothetical protein
MTEPAQFLELGTPRMIAIEQLVRAFPGEEQRFGDAARANRVALTDQIPIGKAIMICGPQWWGRLDLRGPGRTAFEIHARTRLAAIARRVGHTP